ncbi:hypothetical protein Taro_021291 [Colocasia esculenta]|uniref:Uncharacterized protein n=1 Tax=Colocasia esculenta TaxID=4460 RepID=A0A843UYH7_COLES|nr:hypothetical protein [Colocasia esculenta]
MNVTSLVVAFLLPPLSLDVCMRPKCHALGGLLTSGVGRRRPPTSRSCRDVGLRHVLKHYVVFKNPGRTELPQALLDQGGAAARFLGNSRFWMCVRRVLTARTSHGAGEMPRDLRSSRSSRRHVCLLCLGFVPVQCVTVEVYVVFLDTLTPVFELYVWLRERRQVLRPETQEVLGMGLQLCVCRGMRRVMNATSLVAAFLLPPLSVDVRMRAKCHALGVEQSFHSLCSTRGGAAARFLGDSRFWKCVRRVLAARTSHGAGKRRGIFGLRVLHEGGASALVMLSKRVAHEVGMFYMVYVLRL